MEEKIYKHIIKVQSPENMIRVLKGIDKIYHNDIKLVVENAHYYFEDRQGNIVTFNNENELLQAFRSHKGVKKLYNKLLKDEKDIINDCIKLTGSLDSALQLYIDYINDDNVSYEANDIILREVIGTQLFPMAHIEYDMIMTDNYVIDINDFVSYDENGKVNGLFALDYDIDTIINMLTTKTENDNDVYNVTVGSKEWLDTYKKVVMKIL